MHILFLTDNFPPEGNAPATRTFEHAKIWVEQGHKVTVITCAPNFPEGKVYEGYSNKLYQKEFVSDIEVRRVKTYITANEGFFKRSLDYVSFMFSAFFAGLFVKKPDVVVATSPQFFCCCAGWALSAVRRKPFVFELRDIWPASIQAVGASKSSKLIGALEKIEMFLYRRADLIVSVTESFKTELVNRGIESEKIKVVLNGVDLEKYTPREKDKDLVSKHQLGDKFVVAYIGTHGMAHALETILDAAEAMLDNEEVVFLFAGGGAKAESIAHQAVERKLNNVLVLGRQEKEAMPAIWSICDVSLIHLRNTPLFSKVIPSKIFESMAMGLPMVIGLPKGEATNIIAQNDVGVVVEPEDSSQIVLAIDKLRQDESRLLECQRNCLFAAEKYDRKRLAVNMLDNIVDII
jgi:glycosyltransferase involved in cell wall biosynthesis